ncbi:MAG: response regulator transcription factor [Burkholderiaceae bacterium]|jgi:two-component system response regulator DctR|nr:response regulator transcription factor [Burkholderiaceae bacterium]HMN66001.1 response regulator [Burkholderiaceae bacterium]
MTGRTRNAATGVVHVVEDDDVLADALQFLFESRGLGSHRFRDAESYLDVALGAGSTVTPACLVLDVRMRAMSGIELFDRLCELDPERRIPVVFLTGHGDIGMAVEALKRGAFDFFEKPFSDNRLADRVIEALAVSRARLQAALRAADVRARLERLSTRERDVMLLVLAGKRNKLIADALGISMRTVEVHRASVFAKMGVRSAVELALLPGSPTQGLRVSSAPERSEGESR